MELEEYLGRSQLYRRLRSDPHGQLVERYAARLVEERLVRQGANSDASRPGIPIRSRPGFRFEAGHHSEMKPAT